MRPAALLAVPDGAQAALDRWPRAFYAGCAAARDGDEAESNPHGKCWPPARSPQTGALTVVACTKAHAWAAGWLSVREGWIETLDHGRPTT